ncbi:MAG: HNH endonuclease [Anaerolineae bacterium]|nr:HNH endonuclease [Anaerolineae bacterium]
MNYRLATGRSVILMSLRKGAPYADRVEDQGRTLIYEGHDVPKFGGVVNPKLLDQELQNLGGSLTQNGLFSAAAAEFKLGLRESEIVRVYEKIRDGVWVFNGEFELVDAWGESDGNRRVFKFKLHLTEDVETTLAVSQIHHEHTRLIPSTVKQEVWKRDKGRCVICGSTKNLHFDHDIPFSKGGTSLTANNIRILCVNCNLAKSDKIE